jgi:hypothetical protein
LLPSCSSPYVWKPVAAEFYRYVAPETARTSKKYGKYLPLKAEDAAMETKTINLRVSADAAEMYESASDEEKRKLEALISSRLREAARHRERGKTLEEIMSEMSRKARERGLTPEKLDDILNEE